MRTMQGAVAIAAGDGKFKLDLRALPIPEITKPDDVLVKVDGCGICGSDVAILAGLHPVVPNVVIGHEFIGRVEAVGEGVTHVKVGQRVAVAPNLVCGVCPYCRLGMPNHCLNWTCIGVHMNGGFAEYTLAPASAVLPISPDLPLEEAVFIEPLSCVYAGTSRIKIQPGETAVVLGAGPIGLIFVKVRSSAFPRKAGNLLRFKANHFWLGGSARFLIIKELGRLEVQWKYRAQGCRYANTEVNLGGQ